MPTPRAVRFALAIFAATALLISTAHPTQAQSASTAPSATTSSTAAPEVRSASPLPRKVSPPITGAPFSSVAERRQKQTLSNGTHIDLLETITRMYRDSQGRTRTEVSVVKPDGSGADLIVSATISDPISSKTYSLDVRKREAHLLPMYLGSRSATITPSVNVTSGFTGIAYPNGYINSATVGVAGNTSNVPGATETQLGDDTMLGVPVSGWRTTMVFPVGAVGNDQPITVIREVWEAKDIHIMMLTKTDDPRSGELTMRVTQLDRTEPDASLFQVPPDYTIVEK